MTTPNAGRGCRATGILIHCWWKCNWVVILRDSRTVSYKTKHGPLVQSSNHTPLYISKWVRNYVHPKTCIWMDISALSVQSLSCVQLFSTPWTAACQASLSITNSQSLPKLMSIESVMPSNHLILCHPLLLLPSVFSSIRVFSNESALRIRWPKYWSFSFNISPSNEHPRLISFRMD